MVVVKAKFKVIASLAALACVLALPFYFGIVGNSATRVAREHGLRLPASASHFLCRGDAWPPILDREAVSTFEIARLDLAAFTNQLKFRAQDHLYSAFVSTNNSQPRLAVSPDHSGTNIAIYYCHSPTGDFLFVNLWRIDDSRVGVCLFTDWN